YFEVKCARVGAPAGAADRAAGEVRLAGQSENRAGSRACAAAIAAGARRRGDPVTAPPVDPITLAVVWGALQSIAVEVGTTVHKTAYSEQAREGQDFSVAVFDPQGRMVAQGPYSPGHMGAMSF